MIGLASVRRIRLALPGALPGALLGVLLVACGPVDEGGFASDVERDLGEARAYAAHLLTESRLEPTATEAIAVGYLERHRLGLGSPFRLIEYSLQDPRLEKEVRERLAWALLAATLDGTGYRVDPRAVATDGDVGAAVRHLELIEGAVEGAPAPDGGVLATRLAYAMAAAESSVSSRLPLRVSQAAALIRDRAVAQEDARRLLRAAGGRYDPLSLVTVWRVERRFVVEAPTVLPVPSDVEQDAIALAPRLLEGIRSIAERPRVGPLVPAPEARQKPLLSPAAADRLALEAAAYDAPPQTPVAVGLGPYRRSGEAAGPEADARSRFFDNAVNEERLAAEYAVLQHRGALDAGVRFGVVSAAVALRAYAQERPWFPGFGGPARRDLEERFGVASIAFPESMPAAWRPYYRRMIESSLSDLQRVLPALDVRGLNIRFEARHGSPGTLAVHDPKTRTVFIPAATGAGTLAHEIAHDLDWQTALRRYRVRGDYGTDRAMRLADEQITRVLRGLTTASLDPVAAPEQARTHATRPAEIFARSVDWFVAVALAREGRVNGYLSSVQDDMLTGYGTVTPPDVTGTAGQSLIALLDEVAPVYPETRRWFLESYGRSRAPTAYDLARRILEAPLEGGAPPRIELDHTHRGPLVDTLLGGEAPVGDTVAAADSLIAPLPVLARLAVLEGRLDRLYAARDSALELAASSCHTFGYDDRVAAPRLTLVAMVAEARARGLALATAQEVAGSAGREWVNDRLRKREGTVSLEPAVAAALRPVVERVENAGDLRRGADPLSPVSPAATCGAFPFQAY